MRYDINDLQIIKNILAKRSHERFMQHCWQKKTESFLVGIHTHYICKIIDNAFEKLKKGESSFLVITVPFRHGKSDCISRYLPAHFLGEFPDYEVLLATYSLNLSYSYSKFSRSVVESPEYNEIYPDIKIAKDSKSVQQWGLSDNMGTMTATALGATVTGRGYHLGILDDYCSSRADAESETIRNKTWESFTNDFLTRRANKSITIILATPWHQDDIIGRLKQITSKESELYDPEFPPFKFLSFPAKNGYIEINDKDKSGNIIKKTIQYDYLFLERYSKSWYEQQFSSLGDYSAAGLLQCNPTAKGGNLFNMDKIHYHNSLEEFPDIKYYRVWDLAHSEKQTQKDDPDFTSGTLLGFRKVNNVWELWIKDVFRIRCKAPQRDEEIRKIQEKDGNTVNVIVEESLDAIDMVSLMKETLRGKCVVKGIKIKGDKIVRASYIEPIFDGGNVHILKASWNHDWKNELVVFPSGKHDDQIDNLTAGFLHCKGNNNQVVSSSLKGY